MERPPAWQVRAAVELGDARATHGLRLGLFRALRGESPALHLQSEISQPCPLCPVISVLEASLAGPSPSTQSSWFTTSVAWILSAPCHVPSSCFHLTVASSILPGALACPSHSGPRSWEWYPPSQSGLGDDVADSRLCSASEEKLCHSSFCIELLGSRGGDKIEGHCQHLTLGVGGRRTRGIGSRDGSVPGSLKFCPAVQYYATEMLVKTLTGVTAV